MDTPRKTIPALKWRFLDAVAVTIQRVRTLFAKLVQNVATDPTMENVPRLPWRIANYQSPKTTVLK
jgi:hypothetical protein